MRRRRQCSAEPPGYQGTWRCQLLLGHEGLHKASASEESTGHFAWGYNAIGVFECHTLPGTVRFRSSMEERVAKTARAVGEWAALGLVACLLWRHASLAAGVTFLALQFLLSIRRPRFIDLGRFTAGAWPVTPTAPPLIFGIAWATHGEGRNAKIAGLEVILGPVVIGAFSLVPREEWPAYKRSQAAFKALRKERRP